jgi:hypothetical protein
MEPTDANLQAWNERFRRPEQPSIPQRVRDRLPPLDGLRVLLPEGSDATGAELTAEGALVTLTREHVTGSSELPVLPSPPAHLPSELLRARFDLVYLEPGALPSDELDALFAGVHAALRPLGWLVVFDRHPGSGARVDYFEDVTFGTLVTAVSQAGLSVKRLEEYPAPRDPRAPGEFLLRAEKPQPPG